MFKKLSFIIFTLLALSSILTLAETVPSIYLNEKPVFTQEDGVFIENGYIMVPVKRFAERMGFQVQENSYRHNLRIEDRIFVDEGKISISSGSMDRSFGVKIKVINNTLYAPLDPLCDVLSMDCKMGSNRVDIELLDIPTNQYRVFYYDKNNNYQLIKTEIVPQIDMVFPEKVNGETYENLEIIWKGNWDYDGEMSIETNAGNMHKGIYINNRLERLNEGSAKTHFHGPTTRVEFEVSRIIDYKEDYERKELVMDGKQVFVKFEKRELELTGEALVKKLRSLVTDDTQIQYVSNVWNPDKDEITVSIGPNEKAIFLILTSYTRVDWIIENPNNVEIKGIVHSTDNLSYDESGSKVMNAEGIPIFELNELQCAYSIKPRLINDGENSYYVGEEFKYDNQLIMELFGRRVDTFSSTENNPFIYTPKEIITDQIMDEMNVLFEEMEALNNTSDEMNVGENTEKEQGIENSDKEFKKGIFKNVESGVSGFNGYYVTLENPQKIEFLGSMTESIDFEEEHLIGEKDELIYAYFAGEFTFEEQIDKCFYYNLRTGTLSITIDGEVIGVKDAEGKVDHTFSVGTHKIEVEFKSQYPDNDASMDFYMSNVMQYKDFAEIQNYLKTELTDDTKLYYVESESDLDDQVINLDFGAESGDAILIIETNKSNIWRLKNHEHMHFKTILFFSDTYTNVRIENIHKNNIMRTEYMSSDLQWNTPVPKTEYEKAFNQSLDQLKKDLEIEQIYSYTSVFNEDTIIIGNTYPLKQDDDLYVDGNLVNFDCESNEWLVIEPDKTVYVPLNTTARSMGIDIKYNNQAQELVMKKNMTEVTLKNDDPLVDGLAEFEREDYSQDAIYLNGVRYVRLDRLCNVFNYCVWWDLDTGRIDLKPTENTHQNFIRREDIPKGKFRLYYYNKTEKSTFVMTELKDSLDFKFINYGNEVRTTRGIGEIFYQKPTTVKMDLPRISFSEPVAWINGNRANEGKLQTFNRGYNLIEVYTFGDVDDSLLKLSPPQKENLFYVDQAQLKEQLQPYVDEDTEIDYVSFSRAEDSGSDVDLLVNRTSHPMVLFLNSAQKVNWTIKNPYKVDIKAIVYGSRVPSTVNLETNTDYTIDNYDEHGELTLDYGNPKIIVFNGFEENITLTPSFDKNQYSHRMESWGFEKNYEIIKDVTGKRISTATVADKSPSLETGMIRYDEDSYKELDDQIQKWREAKMFDYATPENVFNKSIETKDESWTKYIEKNVEIPKNEFRAIYFDTRNPLNTQQTQLVQSAGINVVMSDRIKFFKKIDRKHIGAYFVGTFDFEKDVDEQIALSKNSGYARVYIDDVLVLKEEQQRWDTNRTETIAFTKGSHKIAIEYVTEYEQSSMLFNRFEVDEFSSENEVKDFVQMKDDDKTKVHIVDICKCIREDGVVEVDLGTVKESCILFLKSDFGVIWKLNNPNEIEIKGVVLDTRSYASDVMGYEGDIFKTDSKEFFDEMIYDDGIYNYDSTMYISLYEKYIGFGVNAIDGYTQVKEAEKVSLDDYSFVSK